MNLVVDILIFLHFTGIALGFAGGLGMSQAGPRLVAASGYARATWWPLVNVFSRMTSGGLVLLLVTGPAILWLRYGGPAGMKPAFWVKMALVAAALVAVGLSEAGKARLKRGDEAGATLMMRAGPAIGVLMLLVVLSAVFAFD